CVAVCLHDAERRVGGINHFLLPNTAADSSTAGRYGPSAMYLLVERLRHLGAQVPRMTARIVGGSNMLSAFQGQSEHLGARNVEVARACLSEHGIRVIGEDVGGTSGRKLVFIPRDGRAG